jgi:hypothetical protein
MKSVAAVRQSSLSTAPSATKYAVGGKEDAMTKVPGAIVKVNVLHEKRDYGKRRAAGMTAFGVEGPLHKSRAVAVPVPS